MRGCLPGTPVRVRFFSLDAPFLSALPQPCRSPACGGTSRPTSPSLLQLQGQGQVGLRHLLTLQALRRPWGFRVAGPSRPCSRPTPTFLEPGLWVQRRLCPRAQSSPAPRCHCDGPSRKPLIPPGFTGLLGPPREAGRGGTAPVPLRVSRGPGPLASAQPGSCPRCRLSPGLALALPTGRQVHRHGHGGGSRGEPGHRQACRHCSLCTETSRAGRACGGGRHSPPPRTQDTEDATPCHFKQQNPQQKFEKCKCSTNQARRGPACPERWA